MSGSLDTWIGFLPAVLAAIGVLAVPGLILGFFLRLRGWWLVAAAAPLSVSLITVASVVAGWTPLRWNIAPVLALTAVASAAAWAWMRWVGKPAESGVRRHGSAASRWASTLAVILPAALISWIVVRGMGDPTLIDQRYDNFFHINAIQYVLDTGNASPFWVGSMTAPGNLLFYPSGWHAVGSLIAQLAGSGVPMASNALVLVVAAGVWPLSLVLLARRLFGGSSIVTVAAGVLAAASPAFPYLPLHYGPLYPLFLGLAVAPVGIAAMITVLRPGRLLRRQDAGLLVVLLVPGIAVAHPGALLAFLALSLPAVIALALYLWRSSSSWRARGGILGGLLVLLIVAVAVLKFVRPPATEIYWPVTGSLATAVGEVLTAAVFNYPTAYALAVLAVIGGFIALRHPTYHRSIALGMLFVGSLLYVVVAGSPFEVLRTWLTGPWYNNPPRLASIWAISALPVAALGAQYVARRVARLVPGRPFRRLVRGYGIIALSLLGIVLFALIQTSALRQAAADLRFVYGEGRSTDGPILSAGEYKLLDELEEYVPEDAVIAGDPWTGTSFAYGISGRKVLMPHLLMDETPDAAVINSSFDTEGDSPRMCAALAATGVRYVLVFDGGEFMSSDHADFSGLDDLDDSPWATLVASEPGARLYEITSCGLAK
ncbi:MAG: hypothetical protein LBE05_07090 [Microbacterium sp.]|jgi:hypothetical protein|nr:hypothetical protein [Microbacterium sp.]